jgi:hypothetical protein
MLSTQQGISTTDDQNELKRGVRIPATLQDFPSVSGTAADMLRRTATTDS